LRLAYAGQDLLGLGLRFTTFLQLNYRVLRDQVF